MTETNDLRPCPMCGSADVETKTSYAVDKNGLTMVLCYGCGLTASFQHNERAANAIAAWNRRASDPDLQRYKDAEAEGRILPEGTILGEYKTRLMTKEDLKDIICVDCKHHKAEAEGRLVITPPKPIIICPVCGVAFRSTHANRKLCDKCRVNKEKLRRMRAAKAAEAALAARKERGECHR